MSSQPRATTISGLVAQEQVPPGALVHKALFQVIQILDQSVASNVFRDTEIFVHEEGTPKPHWLLQPQLFRHDVR